MILCVLIISLCTNKALFSQWNICWKQTLIFRNRDTRERDRIFKVSSIKSAKKKIVF